MAGSKKKPEIALPADITLSKSGIGLFGNNKLKRVRGHDGMPREGIKVEKFNAQSMQKFIMNSAVKEIFVSQPEMLNLRNEIISTNNLIFYAILYKKLSPSLGEMLLQSDVLKAFNRKNPKAAIVDFRGIDSETAEKFLKAKGDLLTTAEAEIRKLIRTRINNNSQLSGEDKTARLLAMDKFVRWIDKRIWYLYFIVYQTPLQNDMRRAFSDMLYTYLDNTQIAVHMSNLLMEFIQNAEKAHIERIMVKNNISDRENLENDIADPEQRKEAVRIARRTVDRLELSWDMNPGMNNIHTQYKVKILISNFGLIDEMTRSQLAGKMKTNTEGLAISDFYEHSSEQMKLGAGLGLLYNSYLEDICRSKGIKYFCNIFPEPSKEKTTVMIEITL